VPDNVPLAEPARQVTPPPGGCALDLVRAPNGLAGRRHAWETGTWRWDTFYLFVVIAVLIIVLLDTPGSKPVAAGAMVALIPWYVFLGRPLWTGARVGRVRAAVYVAGLFGLFGAAQSQNPEVWFLAFAFAPQFQALRDNRVALWLGIGLNFFAAALIVIRYPSADTVAVAFGVAVAGGGFTVFFSSWVSRIIEQSAERAEIIDQLEATRAELAVAQHEAGRLAERQRLAADIHDTLAQGFTSILMLIQAAQADLDGSHPQAARQLEIAVRTARENLTEARAVVADLAPAQLDGSTLPDALSRLAQAPGADGMTAGFALFGIPPPLPMATEVVLLRVCQEALANVRKHARASSAHVRLDYDADVVRLEVRDDGAGFDPAAVSGGYGLRGMRTRVTEAGGTLTVDSAPGTGTRVSAIMPAGDAAVSERSGNPERAGDAA
jgi:signal transduction histidine kinase